VAFVQHLPENRDVRRADADGHRMPCSCNSDPQRGLRAADLRPEERDDASRPERRMLVGELARQLEDHVVDSVTRAPRTSR
jgi:hypothetical protein